MPYFTDPAKKQRGPNLNVFQITYQLNKDAKHASCSEESGLIQKLWIGKGRPPRGLSSLPLSTPGVIFCSFCGTRAGKKIERLFKFDAGRDQFGLPPTKNPMAYSYQRRKPGTDEIFVYRGWRWKEHEIPLPTLHPMIGLITKESSEDMIGYISKESLEDADSPENLPSLVFKVGQLPKWTFPTRIKSKKDNYAAAYGIALNKGKFFIAGEETPAPPADLSTALLASEVRKLLIKRRLSSVLKTPKSLPT